MCKKIAKHFMKKITSDEALSYLVKEINAKDGGVFTVNGLLKMKGSRGNPNDLLSNQPQHPQKGKEYLDLRNQQLVTDYMKINGCTKKELKDTEAIIAHLHRNSGHCSLTTVEAALKTRQADKKFVDLCKHYECTLCADYGSRFTTCHVLNKEEMGKNCGNTTAKEMKETVLKSWIQHYGKPEVLRSDPEGCFRQAEHRARLSGHGIEWRPEPGEAHWRMGVVERCIETIKEIATRMAWEVPDDIEPQEIFTWARAANNDLMRHNDYSPLMLLMGRTPAGHGLQDEENPSTLSAEVKGDQFQKLVLNKRTAYKACVDHYLSEKTKRALLAKTRPFNVWESGEKAHYWRSAKGNSHKTKQGMSGRSHVPATVLMQEREVKNGVAERRGVVWLVDGDRLVRAAAAHLRTATKAEQTLESISAGSSDQFQKLVRGLAKGSFDVKLDRGGINTANHLGITEITSSLRQATNMDLITKKKIYKENQQKFPKSQEEYLTNLLTDLKQKFPGTASHLQRAKQEDLVGYSTEDKAGLAVLVGFTIDEKDLGQLEKNPERMLAALDRQNKVEVKLKDLTPEEKKQLPFAKENEIKSLLKYRVCEAASRAGVHPGALMKMRWVITKKETGDLKARLVVLGCTDPSLGRLVGIAVAHVGDFMIAINNASHAAIDALQELHGAYEWGSWETQDFVQCGTRIRQEYDGRTKSRGRIHLNMVDYAQELKEIDIPTQRRKNPEAGVTPGEASHLRAVLGQLMWLSTQCVPLISAELSLLLAHTNTATINTLTQANKLVRRARVEAVKELIMEKHINPCLVGYSDAALNVRRDGSSQGGFLIFMTDLALLQNKDALAIQEHWSYDCRGVFDALDRSESSALGMKDKRSALEALALKRGMAATATSLRWCHNGAQLSDCMTKNAEKARASHNLWQQRGTWKLIYDSNFISEKHRKQKGLDTLETGFAVDADDAWQLFPDYMEIEDTDLDIVSDLRHPGLRQQMMQDATPQ
ncbi:unnamed protein product [Prorocentrum cordatum]|uniref:Integrase catalytic domain-containing protein n=1 Tax=Prorocentrum cordatum TaxID=2364126 RepID=A0ABN9U0P3_9DINO|nr:unnamed protein product [Polarella glacialis]